VTGRHGRTRTLLDAVPEILCVLSYGTALALILTSAGNRPQIITAVALTILGTLLAVLPE
jgi:hypothetical protein